MAEPFKLLLNADFDQAADLIEAALAPAPDHQRLGELRCGADGLAGWILGRWVTTSPGAAWPDPIGHWPRCTR